MWPDIEQSLQHEAISSERDAESTYRAIVALGNIVRADVHFEHSC